MIELKKKYVIGTNLMWYELEMYDEFISGLINSTKDVSNKENVFIDLLFNMTEVLETIDTNKISVRDIKNRFKRGIDRLLDAGILESNIVYGYSNHDDFYFHTDYRRDLNYNYCKKVDFIVWGESDSKMPKEGLQAIDTLSEYTDSINEHRYIMCFGDRKMWDSSWDATVHVDYESHVFVDGPESHLDPMQAKSQMSIEDMNKVNESVSDFDFRMIPYTKLDGSFLVISSDLIKSGVNIPSCMLYNDDEGLAIMYDKLCKGNIKQFVCKNLLKVHARRHANKRTYIANEDNAHSFNDKKVDGFHVFKKLSQANIQCLHTGTGKFYEYKDLEEQL